MCVAHGEVPAGTIESRLVPDRGDGLRGSTTRTDQGKRAVTHVSVRDQRFLRLDHASRADISYGLELGAIGWGYAILDKHLIFSGLQTHRSWPLTCTLCRQNQRHEANSE